MVRLTPEPEGKCTYQSASARIFAGLPYPIYAVQRPTFSAEEEKFAQLLIRALGNRASLEVKKDFPAIVNPSFVHAFQTQILALAESNELIEKFPTQAEREQVKKTLVELLQTYAPRLINWDAFAEYVLDQSIGFFEMGMLLRDPELNEIMANGNEKNIFVEHQKYGMCQTNIYVEPRDATINRIITKAARYAGRNFSEKEPLLDARLPDGNRLNATNESISPQGHSITIRKFRAETLSLVDMVNNHTITPEVAAYLWLMIEGMGSNPMNLLISGGSGSGKTTLMNALGACVPYRERIISIEDTLELQFPQRQNWVQLESKPPILETDVRGNGMSMDALLKNALRMRPDRVFVGEVRGMEAQTLFAAMDTGHQGCMSTLHANSPAETLLRLRSEPMNVPSTLLPLLNILIVMQKIHFPGEGTKRRIAQVAEISHMEREPLLSNVFERKPETDSLLKTDTPSHAVQMLADATGKTRKVIQQELLVRQHILEWMLRHGIHTYADVELIFQQYHSDPVSLLQKVQRP